MKTIAISNQKGGVGKTSTALMLADGLKHCGYKVLFVDMDSQCNSTSMYNVEIEGVNTLYDLLEGNCKTVEAIQTGLFGDIIAGDPNIPNIESTLDRRLDRHTIMRKALKEIEAEYDFCIFDTPPSLNLFMLNALCAADEVIIPMKAEKFSVDGLGSLLSTLNAVIENVNPNLKIDGILLTNYNSSRKLDKKVWKELPEKCEPLNIKVMKTPIRMCQEIPNSQSDGVSLFDTSEKSNAALDYVEVIKEILS